MSLIRKEERESGEGEREREREGGTELKVFWGFFMLSNGILLIP